MATKKPSTSCSHTSPVLTLRSRTRGDHVLRHVVNLFHHGIGEELDLGIMPRAIQHDFGGAELVAAVDQRDFAAEAGEEIGLFHGGIAAAHHHDLLAAVEEAVAGGAGADAVADQLLLGFQAQPARRGAGGDDHGAGFDPLAFDVEAERPLREIGIEHRAVDVFGAEVLRLPLHVFHQVGTVDALRKAGEVLHQGGQRKLPAGFVAARPPAA